MSSDPGRKDTDPPGGVVPTRVVVARRRSWTVPVIIAVALVLATVGFLGQKPVPPRPPVEPTPTPPPIAVDWTTVPLDPATFQGALVGRVVSGPRGVLALGQDRTDRHPIAWTSPDGRAWVRYDEPRDTFGGGVPDAAAQVGSSYVAVGYHATPDGVTRDLWTSPDGGTWSRDASPTGRGFDEVRAFIGSGRTAVLVASIGGRQTLLSSPDGSVWAETPDVDTTFGPDAYIADAVDTGSGYLAVGAVGSLGAIWRSPDGHTWSRVSTADPALFAGARFNRVFRTTAGLLLTGSLDGRGGPAMSWVSDDGLTWTEDTRSDIVRDLQSVLALDGGNLGIAYDATVGGPGGLTVWADAQSSIGVPMPSEGPIDWTRQASVLDGRIVVLGESAGTEAMEAWLGTVVGPGARAASPSPVGPSASAETTEPSASAGVSPSPTRAPVPSTSDLQWSRLTSHAVLSDDVSGVAMAGVTNLGPRLVAYGSSGVDPVIWTASDAGHWRRMAVSPTMHGGIVRAVAEGPGGLVAVGSIVTPDGQETPAVWTSTDRVTWARAKMPPARDHGGLNDVIAGSGGLVAVGWRDGDQGSRAVAWTSSDGSAWIAAPLSPDDVLAGGMQAIAHAETGYVAVGTSQPDGSSAVGAAWVSADGRTWAKVDDQVAFAPPPETADRGGGLALTDVVAGGPGFVAIGSIDGPVGSVGAIFTSRDGRSWTRLPPDPALEGVYLGNIVTWAGGLAMSGDLVGYARSSPAIWTSPDGAIWSPIGRADLVGGSADDRADLGLGGIAASGPDLIGVGTSGGYPGLQEGMIWVGAPATEIVPDHLCPSRMDTLATIASMTAADRAACIDPRGVTVSALVKASDGGCTSDAPPELSGCSAYLELAGIEGGQSVLTVPIAQPLLATFPTSEFAAWSLTLRSGIAGPACVGPIALNGVGYEPPDGIRLQCLGVLRLIGSHRIER